jgi:hypothetical protein
VAGFARHVLSGLFGFVVAFGGTAAAQAGEMADPALLAFSVGAFDVTDDDTAGEARLEYRSDYKLWVFKPFAGVMATSNSAAYGYAGLLADLPLGDRLVATVSFAPGLFHDGNGKDLGHTIEFRSQIELSYRFDNAARLGVSVSHMSNAGLDDHNPGAESVMVTYAMPVAALLGQ